MRMVITFPVINELRKTDTSVDVYILLYDQAKWSETLPFSKDMFFVAWNPCHSGVFFFMKYKTIFVLSIIYQKIDGTDSWNDSTWNTKALLLSCIVSIRAADSLATQAASASITMSLTCFSRNHGDVIKWKHFPRYWPFTRGIHQSPMNSPHKGHWRGAFIFCLICAWTNGWVNSRDAGDLRRHCAHYNVTVMIPVSALEELRFPQCIPVLHTMSLK